jgi:hypothetical protein
VKLEKNKLLDTYKVNEVDKNKEYFTLIKSYNKLENEFALTKNALTERTKRIVDLELCNKNLNDDYSNIIKNMQKKDEEFKELYIKYIESYDNLKTYEVFVTYYIKMSIFIYLKYNV